MPEPTGPTPVANRLADLAADAAGLAGAGLVTAGAWQIYHPAAYLVGGAFLLMGAWLNARRN